jgi:RNA polymerase sigma factor (sigma-70 family)
MLDSSTVERPLLELYEIAWLGSQTKDPLNPDLVMAQRRWSELHDAQPPSTVEADAASWQIALAHTVSAEKAARHHAKNGNHPTLAFDDLFQIAQLGIFNSAPYYFPLRETISDARHARVSAGRAVIGYASSTKDIVGIPDYHRKMIAKIRRLSESLDARTSQEIGPERAEEILGLIDPKTITNLEVLRLLTDDMGSIEPASGVYFDSSGASEAITAGLQSITSSPEINEFDKVLDKIRAEDIRQWVEGCGLSERELSILRLRFGLNNGQAPQTLEEVASTYGVSRERIRQIEVNIFQKLRMPKNAENICPSNEIYITRQGYTKDPTSGEFEPYEYVRPITDRIIE